MNKAQSGKILYLFFLMRPLVHSPSQVSPEIRCSFEFHPTEFASKGPIFTVGQKMVVQLATKPENLRALGALEWFLVAVSFLVSEERTSESKNIGANLTFEVFFWFVQPFVISEIFSVRESFVTNCANERLDYVSIIASSSLVRPCVYLSMLLQISSARVTRFAEFARVHVHLHTLVVVSVRVNFLVLR